MRGHPARFRVPPDLPQPGERVTVTRGQNTRSAVVVSVGNTKVRIRYADGTEQRIPHELVRQPVSVKRDNRP